MKGMVATGQLANVAKDVLQEAEDALLMARHAIAHRKVQAVDAFMIEIDGLIDRATELHRQGDHERADSFSMAAKLCLRRLAGVQDQIEREEVLSALDNARAASDAAKLALSDMIINAEYGAIAERRYKAATDIECVIHDLPQPVKKDEGPIARLAMLMVTLAFLIAFTLLSRAFR